MTDRFTKRAGSSVLEGLDDDCMTLIGRAIPDWVRLPDEVGGARLAVEGSFNAPCPACGDDSPAVEHLICEQRFGVAECSVHAFVWYRVPTDDPEELS